MIIVRCPQATPSQRGLKSTKWPFSVWSRTSLQESLLHSFFVWKTSATKL